MNAYEKLERLTGQEFKLITGVTRKVFAEMLEELRRKYAEDHAQGGQKGVPVELRLTLALEYWREYRSFRHMANDHQIKRSIINRAVMWVEDVLGESEEFKLKEMKERFKPGEDSPIEVIVVDVEEQPIERPMHGQEASYSGKKNAYGKVSNRD